ncbi:MAG: bifunctional histidinol-phosphatase/imidazoleglycerol-phosphate dehydratase HisB [Saprospiraceae bacterium]|nr:bifunctional histidinol-phosphatase/imidazoleglycerol-phosphate dehydratase HisB [Saprospiraceae bacterium]
MKKALFIDRDGTLVLEPDDYQVDQLEKVVFYPGVFYWLSRIVREMDYVLVMVTNQDGLGTDSFPEETFWPAHNHILKSLENEGVKFEEILIDRTFKAENASTRKPNTGMVLHYMNGEYDLDQSFVIGDRITDVKLAENMGARGIWLNNDPGLGGDEMDSTADLSGTLALVTQSWEDIYNHLKQHSRQVRVERVTKETAIQVNLNLDGSGRYHNNTGVRFFDHMLDQVGRHARIDLEISAKGDLDIDPHHTIEDTAITLGEAFRKALGDKRGIERYGFYLLTMDESMAQVALDFGGRPWMVWNADIPREKVGQLPVEMVEHFFKSFSDHAQCNLNIRVDGTNAHHMIEALFKAFARAVRMAITRDPEHNELPTTKGML